VINAIFFIRLILVITAITQRFAGCDGPIEAESFTLQRFESGIGEPGAIGSNEFILVDPSWWIHFRTSLSAMRRTPLRGEFLYEPLK
jgi:hypothetical protein